MHHQQQQQQHTTTNCPQRSMAWITINSENKVTSATKEMIQLLNIDPTNQYLDNIWQTIESDQSYQIVSTFKSLSTLCICTHQENNRKILICTDITDLNHMYLKKQPNNISITRLTMYGTIEATFQSQELTLVLPVGQPMMRYIHQDDVQEFCAGLNKASKYSTMATFHIRIGIEETNEYQWSELTVMTIENGRKILCLIKPTPITATTTTTTTTTQCYTYDSIIGETVTQMQSKFWYAIEHGMTFVARSIATSLLLVIHTVWQIWYNNGEENKSWTGLFATSSEYLLRKVVKSTKERPEIETLCKVISFCGIPTCTSRSFIDHTLDQTSEWLISKTQYVGNSVGYDAVV